MNLNVGEVRHGSNLLIQHLFSLLPSIAQFITFQRFTKVNKEVGNYLFNGIAYTKACPVYQLVSIIHCVSCNEEFWVVSQLLHFGYKLGFSKSCQFMSCKVARVI